MFLQYTLLIIIISSYVKGAPTTPPTGHPTGQPTGQPSRQPTGQPSRQPTGQPTAQPSAQPTSRPSIPTGQPSSQPSRQPTAQPTGQPSGQPTQQPSRFCSNCAAGQFYDTSLAAGFVNTVVGCASCLQGYTCAGGCSNPIACTAGHYNGAFGQLACLSCSSGSYSTASAALACITCPGGYSCATTTAGNTQYFCDYDVNITLSDVLMTI